MITAVAKIERPPCFICENQLYYRYGKERRFGKGSECRDLFDGLEISLCGQYEKHLNRHNVIYITFSEMPNEAIRQIKERRYDLKLKGKLGEEAKCRGRIVFSGRP